MATFRVFHNYGSEGWKSVGDFVEVIDVIDAYRRADYERDRKARVKPEVV